MRKEKLSTPSVLVHCQVCGYYGGIYFEKNNGEVPVICRCKMAEELKLNGKFPSPSMYSPDGRSVRWIPITNHLASDGRWWHVSHYGSPEIRIR